MNVESPRLATKDVLLHDLRYTFRMLRRDAGFTLFAILIIGLGIGSCSTVFSVLNTLLIRPLPFRDPGRLVWVANKTQQENDLSGQTVQVGRLLDLRERNHSFADIAGYFAFYGVGDNKLTGSGEPERLSAVPVSQNFFPLLGVSPMLGRQFTAEECKFNGPKAVLLSYGLWQRRFGSDPRIVGQAIRLDDAPVTVVGVLPATFDFAAVFAPGTHIDLFSPFALSKETDRWGNTLALIGRLKPGVPLKKATAESEILGNQISAEHPTANYLHPKLSFLSEHVSGRLRPALWVLACSVMAVMLIVCANLSNLMLARTASRQKEIAIRAALGAGQRRLFQQLLTESLVLTGFGALVGVAFAMAATRAISHLTAFAIPLLNEVHVDRTALLFTLLLAVITGLVLGIAPSLHISALSLHSSLTQRTSSETQQHAFARSVLVVSEIAFACVLLVGAGLLIRSFLRVLDVNMGFEPQSAASLRIDPGPQYKTQEQQNGYFSEVLRRVRDIPGVESAGLTDVLPLGHNRSWGSPAKGKTYDPKNFPDSFVRIVSEGYARSLGIPLRKGRDLTERDNLTGKPVMLINETLARTLWSGQNPIGQIITGDCAKEREVVGVVGDVRHMALEQGSGNEMYIPIRQCQDWGSVDLVVRSHLPFPALASSIDAAIRPIEPSLPRGSVRPLTTLVDRAVSPRRFTVLLLTGFAAFALLLASLGIYAVISYSVGQKTQEIGVRLALGATPGDVQSRIVRQTLGLALLGLGIGAAVAFLMARLLSGMLFGVTSNDPLSFAGAAALLLGVAVIAGYLPALRASRIEPMIALRST
jgi:predicted permease